LHQAHLMLIPLIVSYIRGHIRKQQSYKREKLKLKKNFDTELQQNQKT